MVIILRASGAHLPSVTSSLVRNSFLRRLPFAQTIPIGQRFGTRQRPYVLHEAKAGSVSLLHEMGLMWSSQFRETATHPFREKASGNADPSMMFMLAHFVVERWRETLLWSFIVAKHGALDDGWTRRSLEGAWKDLGGVETNPVLQVQGGFRETLTGVDAKLSQSGHSAADPTTYEFCGSLCFPDHSRRSVTHTLFMILSLPRRLSIPQLLRWSQEQVATLPVRSRPRTRAAHMCDSVQRLLQERRRPRIQPRV